MTGVSPAHDLAVLRIEVDKPPPAIPIGSSHDLRVGQNTLAIGNPFGLDWTLTTGIISALDRALPTEDGRGLIEHLIQTDELESEVGVPLVDPSDRNETASVRQVRPEALYHLVGVEIHRAGAVLAGGHLRSQLQHLSWHTGWDFDNPRLLALTRTSNSMDMALLVRDLVPLLDAYDNACARGDGDARIALADATDGLDALENRHPQIEERDIRMVAIERFERLEPVRRFGDDVQIRLVADDVGDAGPDQQVVVDDQDAGARERRRRRIKQ